MSATDDSKAIGMLFEGYWNGDRPYSTLLRARAIFLVILPEISPYFTANDIMR
ncbi:MAG TPA: hypothetical protein V6C88_16775 [Chroococcidiopsis sp.]